MKKINIEQGEAICHDCKKEFLHGDKCVPYETADKMFYKCTECHKKDSALRDFQKTEVYARIVGYIRPVEQWNVGKAEEYLDRKEFVVDGSRC